MEKMATGEDFCTLMKFNLRGVNKIRKYRKRKGETKKIMN